MANLRGGTFEKQVKDAVHRLEKFRNSRHNKQVNGFVSVKRLNMAKTMLNKFSNYLQEQGISSGKLNTYMSDTNIVKDFLDKEVLSKSIDTAKEYTSLFNKTLEYLKENNVKINDESIKIVKETYNELREFRNDFETGRYIDNAETKINEVYGASFETGVIAEIQLETGLRISEAFELAKNFDNYYNNGEITGLIGKANHEYEPKGISYDLANKIELIQNKELLSKNSYRDYLKDAGIEKSHDLRITYAKNLYNTLKGQGYTEKEALKEVSRELNHTREQITKYYLARA